jgi:uncharacterized protein (UPF0332 family)
MKTAEKTKQASERRLIDAMIDVYYGVLTPSQALIMLYGLPPPTHKESSKLMEDIFVKKEKMLKKSDLETLEKAVKAFKAYEHDPKFKISGKEIDELIKGADKYFKTLEELRKQIDKRAQEKTIEQIYNDVFGLLKAALGKKAQSQIIKDFEEKMVKKGKFTPQHLKILNNIVSAKADFKKGKLNSHKVDQARKDASILINDLLEFSQRCDLVSLERGRMRLKHGKNKIAELLIANNEVFLFQGKIIKKLTDKVQDSNIEEVNNAVEKQKNKQDVEINPRIFTLLKKELGNFEIVL